MLLQIKTARDYLEAPRTNGGSWLSLLHKWMWEDADIYSSINLESERRGHQLQRADFEEVLSQLIDNPPSITWTILCSFL